MILPLLILYAGLAIADSRKSCLLNTYRTLSSYQRFPKQSLADGSKIINVHAYQEGIWKNPKWKNLATKIQEVRDHYAIKLNEKRKTGRAATGYQRMKKDAANLEGRTVEQAFQRFNPGKNYELSRDGNKVVISPKNKVRGQTYVEILYDVSGNYFRLQKGRFDGGYMLRFLSEKERFIDWHGNIVNTEGRFGPQEFQSMMQKTHWNMLLD